MNTTFRVSLIIVSGWMIGNEGNERVEEREHASVCKKEGECMMDYDGSDTLSSLGDSSGVTAFLSNRSGMSLFSMGEPTHYANSSRE